MSNEGTPSNVPHNIFLQLEYLAHGQLHKMNLEIPPGVGWNIIEAIVAIGNEQAIQLGWLGVQIAQYHANPDAPLDEAPYAAVKAAITTITGEFFGRNWETEEDRVLAFTHKALLENRMRWEDAAVFATHVLGKKMTAGALRKRLERWAPDHGLPKVAKYKPRQPKVTG
jgi:hypothetical protein